MNRVTAMIYRLCLEAPPGKVRVARIEQPNGDAPRGAERAWWGLPAPRSDLAGFFEGTEHLFRGYEDACYQALHDRRKAWGDWQCAAYPETFELWWPAGSLVDLSTDSDRTFYDAKPVLRVFEFDVDDVMALPMQYIINPSRKHCVAELHWNKEDLFGMRHEDWRQHDPLPIEAQERPEKAREPVPAPTVWFDDYVDLADSIRAIPAYWEQPAIPKELTAKQEEAWQDLWKWPKTLVMQNLYGAGMNLQQIPKIDTG